MNLIKNQSQTQKNQPIASDTPSNSPKQLQSPNRINSVYSKSHLQRQKLQTIDPINIRPNSFSQSNKENQPFLKVPPQKNQLALPSKQTLQIKRPLKLTRKFSLRRTLSYTIQAQKIRQNFVDVGVSTNPYESNKESYEDYIKFRLTQRDKFQKFRNLFNFIQNLAGLEQQNLKNNLKQLESDSGNNFDNMRQKRVTQLMAELQSSSDNFNSLFKEMFRKQRKMMKELTQNQISLESFMMKIIKQTEEDILKVMVQKEISNEKMSQKDIKEIFSSASKKQDEIFSDYEVVFNQRFGELQKIQKQIEDKYNHLEQNTNEQARLIKNCVLSIIQLPQLSIGLFGLNKTVDHDQTNNDIKSYCTNTKKMPHISDFFVKKGDIREAEINEAFSKCCQIKCMTCIYMRSKMRFIYDKNSELQPIIKVLMKLIQCQNRERAIQRRFTKAF